MSVLKMDKATLNSPLSIDSSSNNCCKCDYCSATKTTNDDDNSHKQNKRLYRSKSLNYIDDLNLNKYLNEISDSFKEFIKLLDCKNIPIKELVEIYDKHTNRNDGLCYKRMQLKNKLGYDYEHELVGNKSQHHFCFYYYNLWQGEYFKAKAFEKQNEKLENRVKYLENKLEKETLQQIKISLEWRKAVTNLVDENARLKILLKSSSTGT